MSQSPLRKYVSAAVIFALVWLFARYLLPIVMPFLLSALLALAAEPLTALLQKRLKLPRAAASGISVFLALALTLTAILALLALAVRELGALAGILPDLEDTALQGMESLELFLMDLSAKAPRGVEPMLKRAVSGFFSDGTQLLDKFTALVLRLASGVVTHIPESALSFGTWILACFMISAELPRIRERLAGAIPESWRSRYLPAMVSLKRNVSGWLVAQFKLMGVTFLVLCAGFFLLRIPYAPLWAALVAVVDALPVLGTGTVLVPWSLVCFLQGSTVQAVGLLGVYAAAAMLRSVLEPRLVGRQLGLDPLVTLLALYAGYRIWGVVGMLLSPLLAVTVTQLAAIPRSGGQPNRDPRVITPEARGQEGKKGENYPR